MTATLEPLTFGRAPEPVPGRATAVAGLFLDRDGVLIENRHGYVRSERDVVVLPGAPGAVRRLASAGYRPVVVSNQAMVGKGLVRPERAAAVHRYVIELLAAQGAQVGAGYLGPHAPGDGCACRKPAPGMLLRRRRPRPGLEPVDHGRGRADRPGRGAPGRRAAGPRAHRARAPPAGHGPAG
jgi:histidinol-phosphate phosphatase family protein